MIVKIKEHIDCINQLDAREIEAISLDLAGVILSGHKILVCGNGGSAADAQHFAGELTGRFMRERKALPAIALTTDTSILTAIGNDYGFDWVFERQVEALGQPGDALICISTSGESKNLVRAAQSAKKQGLITVGLLGRDGGCLKDMVQVPYIVRCQSTPRIQEAHIFILHSWAEIIEASI